MAIGRRSFSDGYKAFSKAVARILSSRIYFSLVRKPLQSEQSLKVFTSLALLLAKLKLIGEGLLNAERILLVILLLF